MKKLGFIVFVTIVSLGSLGFGQDENKPEYIRLGRITGNPGTLIFYKIDGKLHIKAQDDYRSRPVGLPNGYTPDDMIDLVYFINQDAGIKCLPLVSAVTGDACHDEIDLSEQVEAISSGFFREPFVYSTEYPLSLDARDYWRLYDFIVKEALTLNPHDIWAKQTK